MFTDFLAALQQVLQGLQSLDAKAHASIQISLKLNVDPHLLLKLVSIPCRHQCLSIISIWERLFL
jgi:hypothetical protein